MFLDVQIKRLHQDAVIPAYAKPGDAGMDLTAISMKVDPDGLYIEYGTGLAIAIPDGYVGYLFPRSSVSNTSLDLKNSVGVIDSSYRGEIRFRFHDHRMKPEVTGHELTGNYIPSKYAYAVGDRIGQIIIMPIPAVKFTEVDELTSTERGVGGYGSTGK